MSIVLSRVNVLMCGTFPNVGYVTFCAHSVLVQIHREKANLSQRTKDPRVLAVYNKDGTVRGWLPGFCDYHVRRYKKDAKYKAFCERVELLHKQAFNKASYEAITGGNLTIYTSKA